MRMKPWIALRVCSRRATRPSLSVSRNGSEQNAARLSHRSSGNAERRERRRSTIAARLYKQLASDLAKHCDASIADVMEEALALLAKAKRFSGGE